MTAVASPEPESGPPTRPATGRRRAAAVPALSIGWLDDVAPGSLLVAMPALTDPTFAGTVVFVLDHSDSGTLGVVLGRPSQVRDPRRAARLVRPRRRSRACSTWAAVRVRHRAVPGRRPRVGRRRGQRAAPVAGDVYLVDLDGDPVALPEQLTGLRVFAGYAGWSPGQLAGEIAEGAWACVPAARGRAQRARPGPELWRQVMGRQTGRLAVLSTAPADPVAQLKTRSEGNARGELW